MSNIATKRSLTYWIFALLLLMLGGPILTSEYMISPNLHNILDGVAALFAIIATIASFVAWRRTKATVLLLIAITFAGTAVLDIYHEVADAPWMSALIASSVEHHLPWSWHASRMFMAIGFLIASLHLTRDNFGSRSTVARKTFPAPALVLGVAMIALPATIYFLMHAELPSIYFAQLGMLRAPELLSGIIYLIAMNVFLRKGNWRTDSYGHWLTFALVVSVCAQFFCMAFSQEFLDTSFGAAHLLKDLSYVAVAIGLLLPHRAQARSEDADASKPKGLGLGVKVAILCGFIGFICVVPVAIMSSTNLHKIAATNGIASLSSAAVSTSNALDNQRRSVDSDLSYLAEAKVVAGLNRARLNGGFDDVTGRDQDELIVNLSRMAQNLLVSDSQYLSLAYIDPLNGQPLVRVEQLAFDGLAARNREVLQESEAAIARQVLEGAKSAVTARSSIFMLSGDLGGEELSIPVEATALALYSGETDEIDGILIAHSDIAGAFAGTPIPNVDTELFVVNSVGEFLVHPDPARVLSPSGAGFRVDEEFLGADFSRPNDAGQDGFMFTDPEGEDLLVGYHLDQQSVGSGESLLYIYSGSREQMEEIATSIGENLQRIAQFNLLVAIVIGWFFARRFAKPVQEVSAAAVEFGRSGTVTRIAYEGRDEIGLLAKSLTEMMKEVASQREKMILLSSAVESSVDSTIITTTSGIIEYINPTYERYAGVDARDLIGKSVMSLPEFKDNRHILSETPDKKGDEYVWVGEMSAVRADGRLHDELVSIAPIRNAEGVAINQSMVIEDITKRKEMERHIEQQTDELQRSNRDLEQFAYVASHDLKAPLRAIEVLVSWLKDDLEDYNEGDVQENLDLLKQRTTRLSRLLDDLLAYSRAGRKIGDIRTINTREFVEDIVTLIHPPEGFVVEVADDLPEITTHHVPLETVFRNLLSNAVKHSPDPAQGRVRVYAKDLGERVQFSVEDNGIGIPAEYAEKVFKMFQTLKARDEKEGSGMGLAIVQRIIDWQDGEIWFEDGPDGHGAVFHFTWSKTPTVVPEIKDEAVPAEEEVSDGPSMTDTQTLPIDIALDPNATQALRGADAETPLETTHPNLRPELEAEDEQPNLDDTQIRQKAWIP